MGWFAIALADLTEILPPGMVRDETAGLWREMRVGVLPYSDEATGMYWQVVDQPGREGNYLETSGSSMLAYAMLKGARLGVLPEAYAVHGRKTFEGIVKHRLTFCGEDIRLDGICLVAGLGPEDNRRRDGTFAYYVSEPVVSNDAKGVAPFVLAYTEMRRLSPEQ